MKGYFARRRARREVTVLAVMEPPLKPWFAYDLMRVARVSSGIVYPLLARLEREGRVESRWVQPANSTAPIRRLYWLTPSR